MEMLIKESTDGVWRSCVRVMVDVAQGAVLSMEIVVKVAGSEDVIIAELAAEEERRSLADSSNLVRVKFGRVLFLVVRA